MYLISRLRMKRNRPVPLNITIVKEAKMDDERNNRIDTLPSLTRRYSDDFSLEYSLTQEMDNTPPPSKDVTPVDASEAEDASSKK